jgi:hypothetical protein
VEGEVHCAHAKSSPVEYLVLSYVTERELKLPDSF